MPSLDARLADRARRQHMLITLVDVRGEGGSLHHVHARVGAGRWRKVETGVYLINGAPFDWPARVQATTLAAGEEARVSHFAAARALGLPGFENAPVEVSVPRGQHFRRPGCRVHESTDLDRCRTVVRDGLRITDADRTILDLARYLGVRRLAKVIEDALRLGLVTRGSLFDTLVRHARQGRHGIRRLRAVLVGDTDRPITDTEAERLTLVAPRMAGLPEPVLHHRVETDTGRFVAEVDFAYPQWKIAIEVVGSIHDLPEVRDRDAPRHNDLEIEGWLVLVFRNEVVRDRPDRVVRDVRDAIASRSAR